MNHPSTATALAIGDAAKASLYSDDVMDEARNLLSHLVIGEPSEEQLTLLYRYSAILSATVATEVTAAIYTEEEMGAMIAEIHEFDSIEE